MKEILKYEDFINENIFYELRNKKWIDLIDKVLSEYYTDQSKSKGIILTEEDPYGEEDWEDNVKRSKGLEKSFELLRKILPHTHFGEMAIDISNLNKLIDDTENDEYGTKTYHLGGGVDVLGHDYTEQIIILLKGLKRMLKKMPINKIKLLSPNSQCVTWTLW